MSVPIIVEGIVIISWHIANHTGPSPVGAFSGTKISSHTEWLIWGWPRKSQTYFRQMLKMSVARAEYQLAAVVLLIRVN